MSGALSWGRRWAWVALALALGACGDDDGGMDAGMDAAAVDAPPECTLDEECDDGLFCNGEESCVEGRCFFADAPSCDDGVACTTDLCDEELDACVALAPDEDGDGARDASCLDAEGASLGTDCDDADALRFPGNPEVCDPDHRDEDCNPDTFGARDVDRDGFLDAQCCNTAPDGSMACGDDCRDVRPGVNPVATEACDGVDNDCDGIIDEGVILAGHHDADGDGFGDEATPRMACPGAARFVPSDEGTAFDCDDADPARNPGQVEVCDMVDNDCDGLVDNAAGPVIWYADVDRDGFGDPESPSEPSCAPIPEHSLLATDCDDADPAIHPAAAELCDAVDNDCNGQADFEIAPGDFEDDDGDGLVDIACGPPRGVDCNDEDPTAGPGIGEVCDGRDNDCDDLADEGAMDLLWYFDADGDGHGSAAGTRPVVRACSPPAGYVGSAADCDDADATRAPGLAETCDALDQDCDGAVDEDGICACPSGTADCDGNGTCETDTTSDTINCGMCRFVCSGDFGPTTVDCVASECTITRCPAGRADCNADDSDGCEVFLSVDPAHCGGCGRACVAPAGTNVASVRCEEFGCEVDTCDPGFADCNGRFDDGCEVNTASDAANCGACGNFCIPNRGEVSCVASACRYECVPGESGDCDGDPTNGCEQSLESAEHCGACDNACPGLGRPGTRARCVDDGPGTRCELECEDGAADCDGSAMNGCEATVSASACGCGMTVDCDATSPGATSTACVGRGPGSARCEVRSCAAGLTVCDGRCVDTDDDARHCGGCLRDCGPAGICTAGACGCGGEICDGFCVDTDVDHAHCGGCGIACGPSERCEAGSCNFDCGGPPFEFCGGRCVDTDFDTLHCGACGNTCAAMERCDAGTCVLDCPPPQTACGGACVDPRRDDANCGACGNACPASGPGFSSGSRCESARCVPRCDAGFGDCDETSANGCEQPLDVDAHCGACGRTCGVGGSCELGACDPIVQLARGLQTTCAVRGNGTVVCWGDDNDGLVTGVPSGAPATPTVIPLPGAASMVGVGDAHACAIAFDPMVGHEDVFCWGRDTVGQLGNGPGITDNFSPAPVGLMAAAVRLAVGGGHTCALTLDNEVWCWGANFHGQAGGTVGSVFEVQLPTFVTGDPFFGDVIAGRDHTCVARVDSTLLTCWGRNDVGQLGNGMMTDTHIPQTASGMAGEYLAMAAGEEHTCAATTAGLYCWGDNMSQQVEVASLTPRLLAVPGTGGAQDVMADRLATCVRVGDGGVHCRGDSTNEQLVPGEFGSIGWRRIVDVGFQVDLFARGGIGEHRLVRTRSGSVVGWGQNGSWQVVPGMGVEPRARRVTEVTP